jgi:hypothetical protein
MKRTSRLYHDLFKLLKQSDWVDRRHLQTLVWMVVGLICAGCVNLTQWTAYPQSRAKFAQSHQRRFSRWLHNSRINVHRLYSPIIKQSLKGWGESLIVLIIDTSMLWNRYCLIRVSLQYRGRAITVSWRVISHQRGVQITKTNPYGLVYLALANDPISGEHWYIVSDQPTNLQTLYEYSQRFDIEEEFLDEKSNGFQLESSGIRSSIALSRLCLVLAITTLFLSVQGQLVVANKLRRLVDCHWHRGNSYLRLGWDWVRGVLHKGWKLFVTLQLSGQPDPSPARASRKQLEKHYQRVFTVQSYYYAW